MSEGNMEALLPDKATGQSHVSSFTPLDKASQKFLFIYLCFGAWAQ